MPCTSSVHLGHLFIQNFFSDPKSSYHFLSIPSPQYSFKTINSNFDFPIQYNNVVYVDNAGCTHASIRARVTPCSCNINAASAYVDARSIPRFLVPSCMELLEGVGLWGIMGEHICPSCAEAFFIHHYICLRHFQVFILVFFIKPSHRSNTSRKDFGYTVIEDCRKWCPLDGNRYISGSLGILNMGMVSCTA